jgi:hypothetical protein
VLAASAFARAAVHLYFKGRATTVLSWGRRIKFVFKSHLFCSSVLATLRLNCIDDVCCLRAMAVATRNLNGN